MKNSIECLKSMGFKILTVVKGTANGPDLHKVKKKFYLGHNGIRHLEDYITCSNLHPDTELLKKAQWDNILEIEIEVDEE